MKPMTQMAQTTKKWNKNEAGVASGKTSLHRRNAIVAVVVLIVAVGVVLWAMPKRVELVVIAPAPADQPNVLHELGAVEALSETSVIARFSGDVLWMIEEGTFVEIGETVVKFGTKTIEEDIEGRVKDLEGKKENVRRAKAVIDFLKRRSDFQIRQLNIAFEQAELDHVRTFEFPNELEKKDVELTLKSTELEFKRLQAEAQSTDELADKGFLSESARKQKQVELAVKKINFSKAKQIRDLTFQGNTEDSKRLADMAVADAKKSIQVAQFNREQNLLVEQANLELAELDLANFERELGNKRRDFELATVRVKTRGRVAFVDVYKGPGNLNPIQVGETRPAGSMLCKICDTSKLRINVFVNECDIARVHLNQKATVQLAAFPGRKFNAIVTTIGAVATDKNVAISSLASRSSGEAFVNVVGVKLDFTDLSETDRAEIRLGFTCDIYLQLDSVAPAVLAAEVESKK